MADEGFRLSPHQRRLWARGARDARVTATIAIDGDVDEATLREAVTRIAARHEALRTRFVLPSAGVVPVQVIEPTAAGVVVGGRAGAWRVEVDAPALCLDPRSVDVLVDELAAVIDGRAPLEDPPQYPDVAAWFDEQLDGADERQRTHWAERRPPASTVAADATRSAPHRVAGLAAAVRSYAEREVVRPEALVAACWAQVARFTDVADAALVGVWRDGRFDELAGLVGPVEVLAPVRATEDVHELDGELAAAERALTALPVDLPAPDVGFRWLPDTPTVRAGGARLRVVALEPHDGDLPLFLRARVDGDDLVLEVRAAGADAEALAARTAHLLASFVADPTRPLGRHPVLLPAEAAEARRRLHAERRSTRSELVPTRVLGHAEADPDGLAAVSATDRLTHAQLADRSARVAARLRATGVGHEDVVAIVSDASLAWLVGVLGVWRAGAAVLSIDATVPTDRAVRQLAHARVRVALVAEGWPAPPIHVDVITLRACGTVDGAATAPATLPRLEPHGLAVVTFTSGTTGTPKGVAVEHGQLAAYAAAMGDVLALTRGARLASPAAPSVDLGATAWLVALHQGACVAVLPPEVRLDAERFAAEMRALEVDILKITPSHLAVLLGAAGAAVLPRRTVVFGGEPLWSDVVARVRALAPDLDVVNHYGPTETTVGALVHRIVATPAPGRAVPIGRALASAIALPGGDGPMPAGRHAAELWLAGASVARGYLHDPVTTADRFRPDPEAQPPGGRAYRTGDLVRLDADGPAVHAGRDDGQIKLRGQRIEPGEVDRELRSLPGVVHAITLAVDDGGERRLEAWLVGGGDDASILAALRRALPEPMIPTRLHRVDAIPLTAGGKPDLAALRRSRAAAPSPGRPPEGALERAIAAQFEQLLGAPVTDALASFFDLGGHSLLAVVAMARLRAELGLDVSVAAFFDAPSVAGVAASVGATVGAPGEDAGGVVPVPRDRPLRASLAQERMWFWDRAIWPRSFLQNVPLTARLRGPLDAAALADAFRALAARQESLRTSFYLEGPVVLTEIVDAVDLPLRVVDLTEAPDPVAAAERFCLDEICGVVDITRAPALRATLLRLGDHDHVLVVVPHHVIWDGWSTGLLVHELSHHYRAARGLVAPLPSLSVSYADWAAWQHRHLSGARLRVLEDFWRDQLTGARTVHLAPSVAAPPGGVRDLGKTRPFQISPALTKALQALGREHDATLFMVLLAALTAVMHGLSGEDDFTVGGLIANRTTARIGELIGYFVNTIPLRSRRAPGRRTFLDHLDHIRGVTLAGFQHQALPVGRIARAVADRRPEGWGQPLYSLDFMLYTVERPEPNFGDVAISVPDYNTGTADYDMGCIMWQRSNDLSKVDGLECWWEYKTDLFDERTIDVIIQRLIATLEQVVREPTTPLLDLPVLADGERDHSVVRDVAADGPGGVDYVPPGFAAPVARRPADAVASTDPWILVGLPHPGHVLYLLDARGEPVAPGAVGHLHVGGDTIAGRRPTGVRARRRHDGLVERFDAPPDGEGDVIDAALAQHPGVAGSRTLPQRGRDGAWQQVSYVVPAEAPSTGGEVAALERTLADAVARARPGERVIVPGFHHLALRHAALGVEHLAAAPSSAPFSRVRGDVARALRRDATLAVDARHLVGVARALPRVVGVHVRPDAASSPFRFELAIDVAGATADVSRAPDLVAWSHTASLGGLGALLDEGRRPLVVHGIPDHRVLGAMAVARALDETVPGASVEAMRRAVASTREVVDPAAVAVQASRRGLHVAFAIDPRDPARFTAAFAPSAVEADAVLATLGRDGRADEPPAQPPTTSPARVAARVALAHALRTWFATRTGPAPAVIVAVDALPVHAPGGEDADGG